MQVKKKNITKLFPVIHATNIEKQKMSNNRPTQGYGLALESKATLNESNMTTAADGVRLYIT